MLKIILSNGLTFLALSLLTLSGAQAASVTYNANESSSQGPNGAAVDFSGESTTAHISYGSAGYILYAANPTYSDSKEVVSGTDPLIFNQGPFATLNTLSPLAVVAKSLAQDSVVKAGYAGGAPLDKTAVYFFGVAGPQADSDKADLLSLSFKQASPTGYRIAILTRPIGPNGIAVSGITLSSGTSSATAVPFQELNSSTPNAMAFYSFDVTNIKAGDVVTLTLSQPTDKQLLYSGLTIDPLPASAGH
jgi:hypothetical protein